MSEDVIRLGVIGAGRWGQNYLRTIANFQGARVVAVVSSNPDTAKRVDNNCRLVSDWRALIDAKDIDGIIIATPPALHAQILIASIEASKPVLVEKPAVRSREDAQRVRKSLHRYGSATVIVDHTHLFHPAFRALRKEAQALGPIRSIETSAGNNGPYRPNIPVLWDWAPHDLAMCLSLIPGPTRILRAVRCDAQPIEGAIAERLILQLQLAGGIPTQIRLSTLDNRHRWFAVTFHTGTLVYRDRPSQQLTRYASGVDIHADVGETLPVGEGLPLTEVVREFVNAIRTKNVDRTSIDLGLTVVDVIADIESVL